MGTGVAFGRYRLLRRLARGGMAEVFLARQVGDDGLERRVAVKRILPHLSDSEQFRKMLVDEARLAARLAHPHVAHIYDYGRIGDYDFIAMEYVDGVELGQLVRRAAAHPVPFAHAARILADVCAGLDHAHNLTDENGRRYDLVHRDVSPQNVLVGYDGVVKLVDFGIAKIAWLAGATRPGMVKGKYAYMSPEQVSGRPLDARSDVFSAGICLYELLTGVPLFRRDDPKRAMRDIRHGRPLELERLRPDLPEALETVVRRALEVDRERRYPTAVAMQADLDRFLGAGSEEAGAQQLGAWLKREIPRAFSDEDEEDEDLDELPTPRGESPLAADALEPDTDPTAEHDAPPLRPLAPPLAPSPAPPRAEPLTTLVWQIVAGIALAMVLIAAAFWWNSRPRATQPLPLPVMPAPVIPAPVVVPLDPAPPPPAPPPRRGTRRAP